MSKLKMKPAKLFKKLFILIVSVLFLPIGVYLVGTKTNFVNQALTELVGTSAEFTVNLTESYEITEYPWANFAQGGEESKGMLTPVIPQVKLLTPSYIRIDHIFDFYEPVKKDSQGNLVYDWSKLDAEIKNITDTGAKPFLSLSYMPSVLSSGDEVAAPTDWTKWQQLVKNTVEHVSGLKGLGISDVYYEVWNEPDLFGGFKTYGSKNYLTLYEYSSRGAQSATDVLPFKFGGPATTSLYKNWFDNLLKYVSQKALRLDFYSWHRYSRNVNDYDEDIRKIKEWHAAYPELVNLEFIITEAGHDSKVDEGYDTAFSAMHSLSLSTISLEQQVKMFAFELKDGPGSKQYWGRWGMLTHEKFGSPVAKPRYRAYEFLNRMKGEKYTISGQGTWVKSIVTGDATAIRMLIVNYDPYGKHIETVPIHFINVPSQNFIYRRTDFLGNVTERTMNLTTKDYTVFELMDNNTAAIIEIIPQ